MKNRARSSTHTRSGSLTLSMAVAFAALVGSGGCALSGQAIAADPQPEDGYAWVIFTADTVVAEIAGSGSDRSRGLQNRDEVPPGTGMLFTFDTHEKRTFWMKDTRIDLDLAVLDSDHRIVEILTMEAMSLHLHDTENVVFMALEVPGGWFAENAIAVGDQAVIRLRGDR